MKKKTSILTRDRKLSPGFRLFLMTLPFLILVFIFSYLPLWGWRYAFYDYRPPKQLSACEFVGFKHILSMFSNPALSKNVLRVVKNTLGMSLLGMFTSWIPMVFAMFLAEIKHVKYQKFIQTMTTIPNFISWIIVYSIAFAMFSSADGLINNILVVLNPTWERVNFLASGDHMWIKMWAWGQWKSLGYSAVLYIASLAGIDQELYEAASVDGASRFQKMRYITLPSLLPTFFTLLIINVGNFLNRGMDQYFAFQNAINKESIEVIDLYVYNQGIAGSNISFSTAVGMTKTIISLLLLFMANKISKLLRDGESIF
jgi:putative aldouronate transport system permease protein